MWNRRKPFFVAVNGCPIAITFLPCDLFVAAKMTHTPHNPADILTALFLQITGTVPSRIDIMHADASNRKIFRLSGGGETFVGIVNDSVPENDAFIGFTRHFHACGLPVPDIYAVSNDRKGYIEEDLGDATLLSTLERLRSDRDNFPHSVEGYYRQALHILPRFQIEASRSLDYKLCYPYRNFDFNCLMGDMLAFKDNFLTRVGISFDQTMFFDDCNRLCALILDVPGSFFMYRDFQARNIMIKDGQLYFIDYQGGRKGPLQYDVASLLYQSQARLTGKIRKMLLQVYLDALPHLVQIDEERFRMHYDALVLVRLMQVMGTYGKQGLLNGKDYFLQSIPFAIANFMDILLEGGIQLSFKSLPHIAEQLTLSRYAKCPN